MKSVEKLVVYSAKHDELFHENQRGFCLSVFFIYTKEGFSAQPNHMLRGRVNDLSHRREGGRGENKV